MLLVIFNVSIQALGEAMNKSCDVSVLNRLLSFEVKIPHEHVKDFIMMFGMKFPRHGSAPGQELRPVDSYRGHHENDKFYFIFNVTVSIYSDNNFYEFLKDFSAKRELSLDFPEALRYKK